MPEAETARPAPRATISGWIIALLGLAILAGGVLLVSLKGSPYYLAAGAGLVATGFYLRSRRAAGGWVYAGVMAGTLAWALWESGLAFWPLFARLFAPIVLGVYICVLLLTSGPRERQRTLALAAAALATGVCAIVLFGLALPKTFTQGQVAQSQAQIAAPSQVIAAGAAPGVGDWRYYGRDAGGSRYAPYDQINAGNVGRLKLAWTFRTGERANRGSEDQNTPLQIGDTLYLCTPTSVVIAVDAENGHERWRYDPKVKPHFWNRCRGVGYYQAASGAPASRRAAAKAPRAPAKACERRILVSTVDARLIALDAVTGSPCAGFGENGVVDLKVGMGEVKPTFYFPTSTPTVAGDRVIIGGWVTDNVELGEPSGVVRAFSAVTGTLIWAWDVGVSSLTKLPAPGKTYSRATPNVWSTPAFDDALGMVYLPTGNATPDYWGSHRSTASERYSSSVVALDLATGHERWRFQTVHHDLWDYDVPAEPMLVDLPSPGGATPALIQLTKRGQIFVLDRRTGLPLSRVVERRAPQGAEKGEWTALTQPYSPDMPTIGVDRLTEKMMWGVSPLDQLVCRIMFRQARYDGEFTPPGGRRPSLQFPGNGGGQNWGSGAWDPSRALLIAPDIRLPQTVTLTPSKTPAEKLPPSSERPAQSQNAIIYKSRNFPLVSPLFVPCIQPPHGTLTAVSLITHQIVWQVPLGTAEATGPFGVGSGLPIPIGTFGLGGPVATAGGITFHGATSDPYLRAYDNATGKVLWKARLPVAAGATPMTFIHPKTGRQYVVISAGGGRTSPQKGDYVLAFALP